MHTSVATVAAKTAAKAPATMITGPTARFHLAEIMLLTPIEQYQEKPQKRILCNYGAKKEKEKR